MSRGGGFGFGGALFCFGGGGVFYWQYSLYAPPALVLDGLPNRETLALIALDALAQLQIGPVLLDVVGHVYAIAGARSQANLPICANRKMARK